MVVRPFQAKFPSSKLTDPSTKFFQSAREQFPQFNQNGFYQSFSEKAMYVYRIQDTDKPPKTGIVAAVSVHEYLEERVKRHENTLVAKEETQAELLLERQASVKPVLLAHRPHQALADLLESYCQKEAPSYEVTISDTGARHQFWPITSAEDLELIQFFFVKHITTTYIADGHHRFSATARLYQRLAETPQGDEYEHLMCALFPSTTLEIHNFNRLIKAFNEELTPLAFMAQLSRYAIVEPLATAEEPRTAQELTCYLEGQWFRLQWRPETISYYANAGLPVMDVSLLNYCVLEDILDITDIRNDKRIKYVEGPKGLVAIAKAIDEKPAVGFCLFPLGWDAFFRVIDHGLVLPPKSTWFEPRMLNGLVVQPFGE